MPSFGVYPVADALTAGDEISSTYEGRHITLLESEITHPSHADGLVDKGDPVVIGERIVGVALKSAVAATDRIAIDTEGIWVLDVHAANIDGNIAVAGGDALFIDPATCIISKTKYPPYRIPFGYALGIVTSGATAAIAVKVHHDRDELVVIGGVTYFGSVNVGGALLASGGATVAGTTTLQTVIVASSLGVAASGILTIPQHTVATQLPAADPLVAGELWCNAGVVTRSAG